MRTPNHLAGGLVLTGFCSALCGVNIFSSPQSIVVMAVATLLPDIDHPKSMIGRTLKPVAIAINRRWGHRTITHSAVILICSTFIFAFMEQAVSGSSSLAIIYFFAYFSHLLLDMVTLMGVPLLYPFSKNPFVMPANPKWRIRNDDRRAETIAFCLFLLAALFMRPLFEQGFWTTYNRTFGTLKHVASEFNKADDLLEIAYEGKIGTEPVSGQGFCIEATEQYAVILENGRFRRLDQQAMVLKRLLPRHTGRKFVYESLSLVNITIDSLNRLVHRQLIAEIDISSTSSFYVVHHGHTTELKRFRKKYLTNLTFLPPKQDSASHPGDLPSPGTSDSLFQPRTGPYGWNKERVGWGFNPRIPILQNKLQQTQSRNREYARQIENREQDIRELKERIRLSPDMPTKERLYHQLETLRKIKPTKPDLETERNLAIEIAQLQKQERLKNLERRIKLEQQQQKEKIPPTLLSGHITFVTII